MERTEGQREAGQGAWRKGPKGQQEGGRAVPQFRRKRETVAKARLIGIPLLQQELVSRTDRTLGRLGSIESNDPRERHRRMTALNSRRFFNADYAFMDTAIVISARARAWLGTSWKTLYSTQIVLNR
ncbi:hypothetical protein KM043_010631 [Ampulex compressa]|nr:hypothetical protein KM043_010631 [Ampulex compressa]